MIKDQCFTEEWLDQFKKQKDHKRIEKIILEKMIYALHLLERLKSNSLDFVFKGGTSLVLLLEEGNRFSIDSIIGDKMTDFAPNTIGIPYFKGKDQQPFSMEICKQLFDLSKLFKQIENMEIVAASFKAFAKQEIEYRKNGNPDNALTPEIVLHDTIATCAILGKRERGSDDEKAKFKELQRGIIAFGTGFLMASNFRIDDAVPASARIAYLAAKILMNDLSSITYYEGQDIKELTVEDPDWNFLNRLKRQPDKSSFFYWYQAVQLLIKD